MILKTIKSEWFQDYKIPSMYIAFPRCSFKCEKASNKGMCHNSHLANSPNQEIKISDIIESYLCNPITNAVVCGGLEPFDSFDDLVAFVSELRETYKCDDTIVIYTGYTKEEIEDYIIALQRYNNIIVKFGRYISGQVSHYEDLLGVNLASDNQYAEQIS